MRRKQWIVLAILVLAVIESAFAAQKTHDWKTAKVVALRPTRNYVEQTDRTGGSSTLTIDDTMVILENEEFTYFVTNTKKSGSIPLHHGLIGDIQAGRDVKHHSCRFIVNDSVQFYQDKKILHVLDADGQECKLEIFVQARH